MKQKCLRGCAINQVLVLAFSLLTGITVNAQDQDKIIFDLSGNNWQMEGIRPGEGVKLGFHELPYDEGPR